MDGTEQRLFNDFTILIYKNVSGCSSFVFERRAGGFASELLGIMLQHHSVL